MNMTAMSRGNGHWFGRLLQLAMLVSVMLAAQAANAQIVNCYALTNGGYAPAVGTNPFPRDAPTGSTSSSFSTTVGFQCDGYPSADRDIFITFTINPSGLVPGFRDVYPTNIGGVGVRYTVSNGAGTSCRGMPATISGSLKVTCHQLHSPRSARINYHLDVAAQFVKTGPFNSGALATIPSVTANLTRNNQSGTVVLGTYFTGASGSFINTACSVRQPAIQVPMPVATRRQLGSVGATSGATPFAIALDCDPGVRVAMTMTDATTPSNRSCTLSLAPDSTARGVGYQIIFGGQTICFGPDSPTAGTTNQFVASDTPTSGGPLSVPFQVRYVRTGDLNAGSANALATFTMSYQ
jgi:type 1 fimbria pilin